ncbi:S-layer homology domain-containing protein [Paenibacillus sp. S3N08]|uniref:S-layer homology domain-containing protein n=2 Tax=Paenibacillus agricola TaxID=2716264 RepID=A0ABX0J1V7_9BACL|nr:S-layer homology domain-containing protein [Paenibacillus agricola]
MKHVFKKVMVTGLALVMVVGGSTAAFADNNGKGNDKNKDQDRDKGKQKVEAVQKTQNYQNIQTKFNEQDYKKAVKLTFDDVKGADVEWAMRYIASLASKRVFDGYEDGTFQPRRTITRIEAITAAVRLMGLREQAEAADAMQANLNFSDADKIKSKYAWATGYVTVALQNDLFEESESAVQPEKEADRLWVTTLLVKALKLQNEAKAKVTTKLNFKDANKIPAGSVGYVAVAVKKSLVDGYEDNTFRPNNPVTRAEIAALLDRTGSQLPDNTSVRGTVNALVSNNLLTLTTEGQAYSVEIDATAYIFRNGTRVAATDLRVGDSVLVRTYGGKAIFVEVLTSSNNPVTDFTVVGTLNTFTLNSNAQIATITINQVLSSGSVQTAVYNTATNVSVQGDISLLTTNRPIELRGSNQVVHTIVIR